MTGVDVQGHEPWDATPHGAPPTYAPPPSYAWPPHLGYGYPAAAPVRTPSWPIGPGRPGAATTAAVLGFVGGGSSLIVSLALLLTAVGGGQGVTMMVVLTGVPSAAGLITGSSLLLSRNAPRVLFVAAVGACATLVGVLVVVLLIGHRAALAPVAVFVVLALPLPVLTAVFAASRKTRDRSLDRP